MFAGLIQRAVLGSAPAVIAAGGLGPEIVTDGTFSNSANWHLGAGWAFSSNQAIGTATNDFLWQSNAGIVAGHTYRVVFTLSSRTAGQIQAYLGSAVTTGSVRTANNTYTEDVTPTGGGELGFLPGGTFSGTVTNFSVKEVL